MSWWNQLPDAPPPDVARNQRTAARAASIVANPLLGAMTLPAAPPPELMGPQQDQTDSPFARVEAEMATRQATPQFWMENLQNVPPPSAAPAPQQQTAPAAPESPAAGRSFISSEALAAEAARRGISQQDMLRLWTNRVSQQQQADQQAAAAPIAPAATSSNQYSPDAILRRLAIAYEVRGGGGLGGMSPQEAAATLNAMSHLGAASLQDRQSRDLVALQREQMRQANSQENALIRFGSPLAAQGVPAAEIRRMFTELGGVLPGQNQAAAPGTMPTGPVPITAPGQPNSREHINYVLNEIARPRVPGTPANTPRQLIPLETFISSIPGEIMNSPQGLAEVLAFTNQQYPNFGEWWSAYQPIFGSPTPTDLARQALERAIRRNTPTRPSAWYEQGGMGSGATQSQAFATRLPRLPIPFVAGGTNTPLDVSTLVNQLRARNVTPPAR